MDTCKEHEEIKACLKGTITWPKFITTLLTTIGLIITVTIIVTSSLFGGMDKLEQKTIIRTNEIEQKAIIKTNEIEQASIIRDKDITISIKETMEKYIVPMSLSLARIEEKLKK